MSADTGSSFHFSFITVKLYEKVKAFKGDVKKPTPPERHNQPFPDELLE